MRQLHLETPHMHGRDVIRLERALTESEFGDFHCGVRDGVFDQLTANAVFRAKYALGYPRPDHKAGGKLVSLLEHGPGELPRVFKALRARRLKASQRRQDFRALVLRVGLQQVGTKEDPPGKNLQKYGAFWRENGVAWCGLFRCWLLRHAGARVSRKTAQRWGYVPAVHADAIAGRDSFLIPASAVGPGDGVCLFGDEHIETAVSHVYVRESDGELVVDTIGGNTSAGDGSPNDGGEVAHRHGATARRVKDVSAFVRDKLH